MGVLAQLAIAMAVTVALATTTMATTTMAVAVAVAASTSCSPGDWGRCIQSRAPSIHPEIQEVVQHAALVERISEALLLCTWHSRDARKNPEVLVPLSVHHLVSGQIHGDKPALVEHQHADPRSRQTVRHRHEGEQWVAGQDAKHPPPKTLIDDEVSGEVAAEVQVRHLR